tara:strand:- start:3284 stop:3847 length:564 start_codon:yes stop_codon:yes gene_type:complete
MSLKNVDLKDALDEYKLSINFYAYKNKIFWHERMLGNDGNGIYHCYDTIISIPIKFAKNIRQREIHDFSFILRNYFQNKGNFTKKDLGNSERKKINVYKKDNKVFYNYSDYLVDIIFHKVTKKEFVQQIMKRYAFNSTFIVPHQEVEYLHNYDTNKTSVSTFSDYVEFFLKGKNINYDKKYMYSSDY